MLEIPNYKTLNITAIVKYLQSLAEDNMFMVNSKHSQDEYYINTQAYEEHKVVSFIPVEDFGGVDEYNFDLNTEEHKQEFVNFVFQDLYVYHDVTYPNLRLPCEEGAFHNDK